LETYYSTLYLPADVEFKFSRKKLGLLNNPSLAGVLSLKFISNIKDCFSELLHSLLYAASENQKQDF